MADDKWYDGCLPREIVDDPMPMVIIFPSPSGPVVEIIGASSLQKEQIHSVLPPVLDEVAKRMNALERGLYATIAQAMSCYVEIMTEVYAAQSTNVTIAVLMDIDKDAKYHLFSKGSETIRNKQVAYFKAMFPRILRRARDFLFQEGHLVEITIVSINATPQDRLG